MARRIANGRQIGCGVFFIVYSELPGEHHQHQGRQNTRKGMQKCECLPPRRASLRCPPGRRPHRRPLRRPPRGPPAG
eukprot:scaffold48125_cov31-Prasinocladus_malaysianus.AAC.1